MDNKIQNILDTIEAALTMGGCEVLDGTDGGLIIAGAEEDGCDIKIAVTYTPK